MQSVQHKKGRQEPMGIWPRMWGRSQRKLCLRPVLSVGTENVRSGDYTAAFSYFQKAAERGYSKAQYNMGLCHEHGRGTPRDLSKVLYHASSSAPRPDPLATQPRKTSRNEQGAGLGESPLLCPSCEGKIRSFVTPENLDTTLRQARALAFPFYRCILRT